MGNRAKRDAGERAEQSAAGELPRGWCWATVGEVCANFNSSRVPLNSEQRSVRRGPFPYYGANGEVDRIDAWRLDGEFVLLAEDGGHFENPSKGVAYTVAGRFWVNNHAHVLKPLADQPVRFFQHLLNQVDWMRHVSGTTRLKLNRSSLDGVRLPLPPLAEQRRIVAKLEALLGRIRRAREALDAVPAMVERYKKSVLGAAFRGELTTGSNSVADEILPERSLVVLREAGMSEVNESTLTVPPTWQTSRLGQLFRVEIGATPARADESCWGGEIPWVSSGEVRFEPIRHTREKITALALERSSVKLMPAGSVLLAMIGEGRTRGQCAVLEVEAATNQNVASIAVSETNVPPQFVFYWLRYQYEQVRSSGAGNNQPALNKGRVASIPIPLPPLDEQRAIVARIDAAFARARAMLSASDAARAQLDVLERSVLAKAFRGELVEQDPADEPASVMLDRVRAERAKSGAPAKKPRKPRASA